MRAIYTLVWLACLLLGGVLVCLLIWFLLGWSFCLVFFGVFGFVVFFFHVCLGRFCVGFVCVCFLAPKEIMTAIPQPQDQVSDVEKLSLDHPVAAF